MRLQIKNQRWQCLPAAFAMALDVPLTDVLSAVGHDGSEIIEPSLPEPARRRGFHPQELIDVCLRRGFAATRIELFPALRSLPTGRDRVVLFPEGNWARFRRVIASSRGVIEGQGARTGHAVAYENGHIYDPDGCEYAYSHEACEARRFFTQHLWRIDRI